MDASTWISGGHHLRLGSGRQIFYRVKGTGRPLLLLHGFPSWSIDYSDLERLLGHEYQIITFDFLGYGASDKPRARYYIAEQADAAEEVIRHLNISLCDIIAHDYGTIVAQELIRRRGAGEATINIRRLVLLNGAIVFSEYRQTRRQWLWSLPVIGPVMARMTNRDKFMTGLAKVFGANSPPTPDQKQAIWEGLTLQNGHRLLHLLIRYNAERKIFSPIWEKALRGTDVPVALIWGMADPVSGAHVLREARKHYPSFQVTELPGIGHYPHTEASEAVAAAIIDFLGAA